MAAKLVLGFLALGAVGANSFCGVPPEVNTKAMATTDDAGGNLSKAVLAGEFRPCAWTQLVKPCEDAGGAWTRSRFQQKHILMCFQTCPVVHAHLSHSRAHAGYELDLPGSFSVDVPPGYWTTAVTTWSTPNEDDWDEDGNSFKYVCVCVCVCSRSHA